jgi:hypothetical protein
MLAGAQEATMNTLEPIRLVFQELRRRTQWRNRLAKDVRHRWKHLSHRGDTWRSHLAASVRHRWKRLRHRGDNWRAHLVNSVRRRLKILRGQRERLLRKLAGRVPKSPGPHRAGECRCAVCRGDSV